MLLAVLLMSIQFISIGLLGELQVRHLPRIAGQTDLWVRKVLDRRDEP